MISRYRCGLRCSRSFKQGKDTCDARMLHKEKLEGLVIEQLKSKVLTDEIA